MNSFFGRFSIGNDSTKDGRNWGFPDRIQFLKQSQVPSPAKTWLTLDEHPDSINDGYFINNPDASAWQDIPASYHNGACGFSFADGHAEIRKWVDPRTVQPVKFYDMPLNVASPNNADVIWLAERTSVKN